MPFRRGGARKRRDSAEAEIIAGLRACGAFVQQISGTGCPDLVVHFLGRWYAFEVKNPKGSSLTNAQVQQQAGRAPYPVIHGIDEALKILLAR